MLGYIKSLCIFETSGKQIFNNNNIKTKIMKTTKIKTYQTWTRKKNTNDEFCCTRVKAINLKEAREKLEAEGREIGGRIFLYN